VLSRLVIVAQLLASPVAETEVTFTFAPPDGLSYMVTVVNVRERTAVGTEPQTDRTESKTLHQVRKSDDGWIIVGRPESMTMSRGGQPVRDPVSDLLQEVVVTYEVGADGSLRSIEGFGGLIDKLRGQLPDTVLAQLEPMLGEQALVARETAEWNGRIGEFVGTTWTIGETVESRTKFDLPTGETLEYDVETVVSGREACPAGSCVRVETRFDTDATAMAELAAESVSKVADAVREASGQPAEDAETKVTPGASQMKGTSSRLIDPGTMLIYAEAVTRRLRLTLSTGDGQITTITIDEERDYSFDYAD